MFSKNVAVLYVLALALFAGACGGGGSVSGPTPITTPPVSTVAPEPFAKVMASVPESGAAIIGTRPRVTVGYSVGGGPYSDLRLYACVSEDGGVTILPGSCAAVGLDTISGSKTTFTGDVEHGKITNAVVPIITNGDRVGGVEILRGETAQITWTW